MAQIKTFETEVKEGDRFRFGKNWASFLSVLNDERINEAEKSLKEFLKYDNLKGKSFLDIGSGSGLFSLAAYKLGANVYSFDFDPQSVECTSELKNRYYREGENTWTVKQGSVLDTEFMESLPKFDIVYSWGVLHHTGAMWNAIQNATIPTKSGGDIFIALYNDEGNASKRWLKVKKLYNSNILGKFLVISIFFPLFAFKILLKDIVRMRSPFVHYRNYKKQRGMSVFHDWFDWLGGLPFEVVTDEQVVDFFLEKDFLLKKIRSSNGLGCNQYVLKRN